MASGDFVKGTLDSTNASYTPPSGATVLIKEIYVTASTPTSVSVGGVFVADSGLTQSASSVRGPFKGSLFIDSNYPLVLAVTSDANRKAYYCGVEL